MSEKDKLLKEILGKTGEYVNIDKISWSHSITPIVWLTYDAWKWWTFDAWACYTFQNWEDVAAFRAGIKKKLNESLSLAAQAIYNWGSLSWRVQADVNLWNWFGAQLNFTANKKLNISSAYVHKSYDGENAESREYVTDENTIINTENGNSKKYVLITPAWPITYDLDGGTVAEDESNPEFYSRVDSFKLNNPTKEAHDFTGWTGTGLNQATTEVTIAEGSNGARNYKANWYNPSQKDDSDEKEKDNNDYRVLPAKDDNNNTESPNTSDTTNPIFYMAVVGGSLLILIGLFVQGKELIKR